MYTQEQPNPIIPVIPYVIEIRDWGLRIIWLGPLIFPILYLLLPRSITGESGTILIGIGVAGFLVTSVVVAGICCARLEDSAWIDTQMSKSSARWIRYTNDFVKLLLALFPTVEINNRNLEWYEKVDWATAMRIIREKKKIVNLVHFSLCCLADAIKETKLAIMKESAGSRPVEDLWKQYHQFDCEFGELFAIATVFCLPQEKRGWYFRQAKARLAIKTCTIPV